MVYLVVHVESNSCPLQGVGFSEETVLQEYREALIHSEKNTNTNNIDNIIQVRRAEKAART